MRKFLVSLIVAVILAIGVVGSISAHTGNAGNGEVIRRVPAWKCHTQISVLLAAISTRNNADIGAASAALAACEGVTAVAPVAPVPGFGLGFPSSNFGFGGFGGFHPFGFGSGFGFPTGTNFGFGLGQGALCPTGSGLIQNAPLLPDGSPSGYSCIFGATGFGVSAVCGGGRHLFETIVAPEPVYQCVL